VGNWFADVNVVNGITHGDGEVMVWVGIIIQTTNTIAFY
jgi:hypothetical protein